MSNITVNPNELAETVNNILQQYSREVRKASAEAVKASAEDCKKAIVKNIATAGGKGIHGTGEYRKSWKAEMESSNDYETVYRVFSQAPYYRLTHLLEYGHEKWVWGHKKGDRVQAFSHIRPAVRDMKKNFSTKLKVGMKK